MFTKTCLSQHNGPQHNSTKLHNHIMKIIYSLTRLIVPKQPSIDRDNQLIY